LSKIEVDEIVKQSGSTLTLGGPGTAVTLGSGATQTGFGRTGTVDWCTTAKTAPLTVESGKGYFINTSAGAVTVTLPSSPSAGDIVSFKDYGGTFGCNTLTIARGGSKINGDCGCATLATNNQSATLIYVDGTKGWQSVQETSTIVQADQFISATGGTITTVCTNYKVHVFDADGTFTVTGGSGAKALVSYMIVAGGGGGPGRYGGGSGGGGFREGKANNSTVPDSFTASPLATTGMTLTPGAYPITIGAGGSGAPSSPGNAEGSSGSNTTFNSLISAGGGFGGGQSQDGGEPGGSGGGGAYGPPAPTTSVGAGNTPPVSPPQGQPGGLGFSPGSPYATGGGGGATEAGVAGASGQSGRGGAGATTSITASPVGYSGGGGGSNNNQPGMSAGAASPCGSGTAGTPPSGPGNNASANRGGGGGGGYYPASTSGGNGGSGKVVIRYKFQ
jgi:hypothetical protein